MVRAAQPSQDERSGLRLGRALGALAVIVVAISAQGCFDRGDGRSEAEKAAAEAGAKAGEAARKADEAAEAAEAAEERAAEAGSNATMRKTLMLHTVMSEQEDAQHAADDLKREAQRRADAEKGVIERAAKEAEARVLDEAKAAEAKAEEAKAEEASAGEAAQAFEPQDEPHGAQAGEEPSAPEVGGESATDKDAGAASAGPSEEAQQSKRGGPSADEGGAAADADAEVGRRDVAQPEDIVSLAEVGRKESDAKGCDCEGCAAGRAQAEGLVTRRLADVGEHRPADA